MLVLFALSVALDLFLSRWELNLLLLLLHHQLTLLIIHGKLLLHNLLLSRFLHLPGPVEVLVARSLELFVKLGLRKVLRFVILYCILA